MELRQLASFLAVAEEGRFTRAAARLFLSPPAVTAHVQSLERELGVRLLERNPVRLTPAGERFVPHARAALEALNAAADAVADLRRDREAALRIGVMGHGSAELTPAIIRAFARARPGTPLELLPLDFTEHVTAVVEHKADVAFVRPAPDDERVAVDVLTREPRIVVVPARGEFAEAEALRLADVLDLSYLDVPPSTPRAFTDYLYFMAARGGERPRRSPDRARNPQEVLASVAAGRGAGSALYSFRRFYPLAGHARRPGRRRALGGERAGDPRGRPAARGRRVPRAGRRHGPRPRPAAGPRAGAAGGVSGASRSPGARRDG
ncbi:LysR family transcriptional regulator [Spirillospora sp. NPDC050679]